MAKLKKAKVMKYTYVQLVKVMDLLKSHRNEYDEMIHQCWDCDSEGEFYETSDNLISDSNSDRNHDIKLH